MIEFSDDDKHKILSFISKLIEEKIEAPPSTYSIELSEEIRKIKEDKSTKKIFSFFESHGYNIIKITELQKLPRDFVRLALLLTENQKLVYPFISAIRRKVEGCFELGDYTLDNRTTLLNICRSLEKKEWIKFQYKNKEKEILFERLSGLDGNIKNFLAGTFGEYGTARLIEKALQDFSKARNGFKYKIFHSVKLKKPVSNHPWDMELDLVIQLPEGYYIFETKMGDILAIEKWVDRTRLFASEGKNRYITCCADENLKPKIFTPFKLFSLKNLHEQMLEQLTEDYPMPSDT